MNVIEEDRWKNSEIRFFRCENFVSVSWGKKVMQRRHLSVHSAFYETRDECRDTTRTQVIIL
jgi:hypothetical protein